MAGNWLTATTSAVIAMVIEIPLLVAIIVSVLGFANNRYHQWGKQFLFVTFGVYITVWQFALWILEVALSDQRFNPFKPTATYYGFPAEIAFYLYVFLSFVLVYTLCWNITVPWMWWAFFWIVLWFPCAVLVFFELHTWREVVMSAGWGTLVTLSYFFILWRAMPDLPQYINCVPWTWFYCIDTWIQDDEGQDETERVRQDCIRISKEHPWIPFC
jgi:hypothetical protein